MTLPAPPELAAPPHWRAVDLLSDLHLQPAHPATFAAWRRVLDDSDADALLILGDLFEAWPGDDAAAEPGFEADCAAILRTATARRPIYFLHGNRDFLVGETLARDTGLQLLADPTLLTLGTGRWLLSHGDALCLGDTDYLAVRSQVRTEAWMSAFLARPLAERRQIALALRRESEARKQAGAVYADVDTALALSWLEAADAPTLVHGHTHRPGAVALAAGRRRLVLTDWELDEAPARAEVLRLHADGRAERRPVR